MKTDIIGNWARIDPHKIIVSESSSGDTLNPPDESLPTPSLQIADNMMDNEENSLKSNLEDFNMSEKNYVTHEEVEHLSDNLHNELEKQSISTNAKIDNLETAMNGKFDHLDDRFDQIPNQIKLALNDYSEKQRDEHKQTVRFLIGTVTIGLISIGATIVGMFV